jgi:hypothetical protein
MPDQSASTPSAAIEDGAPTADGAVSVVSCSRLGRTANPPSSWLTDWLRPRRRRYGSVSGV